MNNDRIEALINKHWCHGMTHGELRACLREAIDVAQGIHERRKRHGDSRSTTACDDQLSVAPEGHL